MKNGRSRMLVCRETQEQLNDAIAEYEDYGFCVQEHIEPGKDRDSECAFKIDRAQVGNKFCVVMQNKEELTA